MQLEIYVLQKKYQFSQYSTSDNYRQFIVAKLTIISPHYCKILWYRNYKLTIYSQHLHQASERDKHYTRGGGVKHSN